MANPVHVDVLSRGVAAWNEWRLAHPHVVPDLSGANLSRLTNTKLAGANLSRARLMGTRLRLFPISRTAIFKTPISPEHFATTQL